MTAQSEREARVAAKTEREEVLECLQRIARALEGLVLHTGLATSALEDLSAQGARFFMTRARKTKRRSKRSRRSVLKSAKWVTP